MEIDVLRLAKTVVITHFVPNGPLFEFQCPDGPRYQLMD